MISRTEIIRQIDKANCEYQWCWDFLAQFRSAKMQTESSQSVLSFQGRLLKGLRIVEDCYRSIKKEERRLIGNKQRYQYHWFANRMAQLKKYLEVVREVIALGKAIGDGFAWVFYERDRPLIEEHLKHQKQLLNPMGIGGLGEQLVIERIPHLDGQLVLLHGITSFLRMGDISLIDLSTLKVACIAELKTKKSKEDQVSISMSIISGQQNNLPAIPISERTEQISSDVPPRMRTKLDRQMSEIANALSSSEEMRADEVIGSEQEFHYSELEELVSSSKMSKFNQKRVGPGLMISTLRLSQSISLGTYLLGSGMSVDKKLDGIEAKVREIMLPNAKDNSLFLGSIGFGDSSLELTPESIPLFWWPIDLDCLKDILFGKVLVITMFNPAHLHHQLETKGFHVVLDSKLRLKRATKMIGKRQIGLEAFNYFYRLIQSSLMTEASILRMVDDSLVRLDQKSDGQPTRLDIRPQIVRNRSVSESR